MKKILITFVLGFVSGAALITVLTWEKPVSTNNITIKQLSGERIHHKDFTFKDNSIVFKTEAKGKGVVETKIPKTIVPEARAWIKKNHAVQVDYLLMYHDKVVHSIYGLSYYRRWGPFALGCGLKLSDKFYGINIGVQYWF